MTSPDPSVARVSEPTAALIAQEDHASDDAPCRGQWCCGCPVHPVGKPWGWNAQAWDEHWPTCDEARGESDV